MLNFIEDGGVVSPKGFKAVGIKAGLKRSRSHDMMLLVSDVPAQFAAAFTPNKFAAPPVLYCQELATSADTVRAIIVNSGNANACTGRRGMTDARRMAEQTAESLQHATSENVEANEVFVSSTGRIGVPLPMEKVLNGIQVAACELSSDMKMNEGAARAIMTTDTVPKFCAASIDIGGVTVTIGGMTKGAGMIAPQLKPAGLHATMLAYMTTDAVIEKDVLRACLADSLDASFNRINIDGDMSTNDTFIVLANGQAGNASIRANTFEAELFQKAFNRVAGELARKMVMDGEGVTRFVTLNVTGAKDKAEARTCADWIARSLLCKTAWFGADPNWGRILAAVGYAGVEVNTDRTMMDYDGTPVVRNGMDAGTPEEDLAKIIDQREFRIDLDLGVADGEYTMWTNDLTYEYVKINADYHT